MKKWITCILSLYILLSAVVPCSVFDYCNEDAPSKKTSSNGNKKDCGDCSPFSFCSATHGFTIEVNTWVTAPVQFCSVPSYGELYTSFKSEYCSRFFQPPRGS